MIVNKKIAKYQKVITALNIVSLILSAMLILSKIIESVIIGEWIVWDDIESVSNFLLITMYFLIIICSPLSYFSNKILRQIILKIDCAKICECVKIKNIADLNNPKFKILSSKDKILICHPLILDFSSSLLYAICLSGFFTNGYFFIIFPRYLGTALGAHFCTYLTIIFYSLCCKAKKKELQKVLPTYLENERQSILSKQSIEKNIKDKQMARNLLEKCGMKFFLKYYDLVKRLPLRDIEVEENYMPAERNERLDAAKSIVEHNLTNIAIDYILQNYADMLTEQELQKAKSIK